MDSSLEIERRVVELFQRYEQLGGRKIATAESCTGGLLAAALTELPGSSSYFLGGINCYSNESKMQLLGVSEELLLTFGAVSSEVAKALADGARRVFGADLAISLTGVAGPGGGTKRKPVGTVWCGYADGHSVKSVCFSLGGTRKEIRFRSVLGALEVLQSM